jgi:hypothetical protein
MSERLMDSAVSRGLFPITFPLDGERQRIGVHAKNKIAPTLIPSTTLRTGSPRRGGGNRRGRLVELQLEVVRSLWAEKLNEENDFSES